MSLNRKTSLQSLRLSRFNRWMKVLLIASGFLATTNPGITAHVLAGSPQGVVLNRADHSCNDFPNTLRIPTITFLLEGYVVETEVTEEDDRPDAVYTLRPVRRSALSLSDDIAVTERSAAWSDRRQRLRLFALFHSWKSYLS